MGRCFVMQTDDLINGTRAGQCSQLLLTMVAYCAHTFAFYHHLHQRCQCRELVRLPQGFLPLPHGRA